MSRRTVAFLVLAASQLMVILDGTVVTVALPAIRSGLGFGDQGLAWVVNAFFVANAVVLLPAGRLGDRVGGRPVFLAGIGLFTAASLWCGLASGPAELVAARALQGVGGGLATAVLLGMVATLFPEDALRVRAFAALAFVGSAGASIGLVAGGLLTELASWPWIFLVNVPIGLVAISAGVVVLDRSPGRRTAVRAPLTAVLSDGRFLLANGVLFTMVTAGMSFQFLSSLYLQDELGLGPLATGAAFLVVTGTIALASLGLSARLAIRLGAVRVLLAGLAAFAAGLLLMVRAPDGGDLLADVMPAFVLMGLGFGLAMPQVTELAMGAAPAELAGSASGVVATTQQAGGAVGLLAVAGLAVATSRGLGYALAAVGLVGGMLLASRLSRPAARTVAGTRPARCGS
jgi:MFS family permease